MHFYFKEKKKLSHDSQCETSPCTGQTATRFTNPRAAHCPSLQGVRVSFVTLLRAIVALGPQRYIHRRTTRSRVRELRVSLISKYSWSHSKACFHELEGDKSERLSVATPEGQASTSRSLSFGFPPPLAATREHARTYVYYARACVYTLVHIRTYARVPLLYFHQLLLSSKNTRVEAFRCVCACVRVPHESAVRLRRGGGEIRDEEEKPTLRIPRGRKSRRKLPLRTVLPAPGTARAHAPFRTYLKERANRVRG